MNRFAIGATLAAVLAAGAMAAPAAAVATPTGDTSAADTVKSLQELGYNVAINGEVVGPLSQCTVTGVHGMSGTAPTSFTTAYVDVSCPSGNA